MLEADFVVFAQKIGGLAEILKHGAYESSFTTTYNAADNKEGLAHRWEFNRISEWGANTISSGIYVRRNAIDSNATGSASLHVKMEWK